MRYKIIGFSILFLSSVAFAADEETKDATKTWDNYKVITEKNIFSRYRTKVVPISERQQQAVVVPEQSYYTLRGITKQSDGYISFIEDARTMVVTRFRKGDSVAEGKVTGINLDYISYENEGNTLKVEIGMNLLGQVSSSRMQYASSGFGNSQGNSGFPNMGQAQGGMGQMPGAGQTQGMGQMPGMGQTQGMGQMPGMDQAQGVGQMPGMGQSQTDGQFQGRGQGPAMGQLQSAGQATSTGQGQQNGQQQGMGQRPAMGQTQSTVQPASTGQSATNNQSRATQQSQLAGQSTSIGQTSATTVQPVTGAQQQDSDSDDIMQRLKERRKKELEE